MTLPARNPANSRAAKRSLGEGLFRKCDGCGQVVTAAEFAVSWHVCRSCGTHHPMGRAEWRALLLDDATLERWDEHISPSDPLGFDDGERYPDRVLRSQRKTTASEAVEVGHARLDGRAIAYGCYIFSFMGGSMGSVVGERISRLFERARSDRLPVVLLHASGGARMQEGILSLMQMAKTVAAVARFREVRQPYLSVLLHPTTGGVAASTAFIGDVNVAEPNALIGFAGPRVIESTLRTALPEGFQRSEFLLSHGMVDAVVPRSRMKATLSSLLTHLSGSST